MGSDRCPACAAAVRKDALWCTLCYADLRPAPAPVQRAAYPQPSSVPVYAAAVAAPAAQAPADALQAPYEHVLAAVYGAAPGAAAASPAVTTATEKQPVWPCTQCGELNDFELLNCQVCSAPFGAALKTNATILDRKKLMIYAVGGVLLFLLLVSAITFAITKRPAEGGTEQPGNTETFAPQVPGAVQPAPQVPGGAEVPGGVVPAQGELPATGPGDPGLAPQ